MIGFPLDIPIENATDMTGLGASVRLVDDDGTIVLRHDIDYSAATPIADVDIQLDGNGPGSDEIIELYDPIMTGLGYERNASTGSDPGDPGGPNSVNHVYVPTFETLPLNGTPSTPGNVFVWADENLFGVGQSSTEELVAGRRIDLTADVDPVDGLAVPMLAAIAEAVPVPEGAAPIGGDADLRFRSPDAFEIDRGAHYLDVRVEWAAPEGATYDEVVAWFSDDLVLAPDGDAVAGAEASFFNDGEWEPSEGRQFDELDWRRAVLLTQRYEGELRVQDDDGALVIVVVFTLDAIAPELGAPA